MAKDRDKELVILKAATEMFSKKGFHLTVIDDIAQCAGIAKGTVYQYFSSKDDLFIQMFKYNYEQYLLLLKKEINLARGFFDKIHAFFDYHERVVEKNQKITDILHNSGMSLRQETQAEIHEYRQARRNDVIGLLEEILSLGQEEGEVKAINKELLADMFYEIVIRYCKRAMLLSYSDERRKEERNQLINAFIFGIGVD